jgi:hypothetical protein
VAVIAVVYNRSQKARGKDFECFGHKEVINAKGDGYG